MIYELIKNYIPVRNHLKIREDEEFLLINSKKLNMFYLTETAKSFYMLIDGNRNIDFIVTELLNEYDVEKEILKKDILEFIRDMQWQNIILLKKEVVHE